MKHLCSDDDDVSSRRDQLLTNATTWPGDEELNNPEETLQCRM